MLWNRHLGHWSQLSRNEVEGYRKWVLYMRQWQYAVISENHKYRIFWKAYILVSPHPNLVPLTFSWTSYTNCSVQAVEYICQRIQVEICSSMLSLTKHYILSTAQISEECSNARSSSNNQSFTCSQSSIDVQLFFKYMCWSDPKKDSKQIIRYWKQLSPTTLRAVLVNLLSVSYSSWTGLRQLQTPRVYLDRAMRECCRWPRSLQKDSSLKSSWHISGRSPFKRAEDFVKHWSASWRVSQFTFSRYIFLLVQRSWRLLQYKEKACRSF